MCSVTYEHSENKEMFFFTVPLCVGTNYDISLICTYLRQIGTFFLTENMLNQFTYDYVKLYIGKQ